MGYMVEKYRCLLPPGSVGYSFSPDEAVIIAKGSIAIQAILVELGVQEPTTGFDITLHVDPDHMNEIVLERVIEDTGLSLTPISEKKK